MLFGLALLAAPVLQSKAWISPFSRLSCRGSSPGPCPQLADLVFLATSFWALGMGLVAVSSAPGVGRPQTNGLKSSLSSSLESSAVLRSGHGPPVQAFLTGALGFGLGLPVLVSWGSCGLSSGDWVWRSSDRSLSKASTGESTGCVGGKASFC